MMSKLKLTLLYLEVSITYTIVKSLTSTNKRYLQCIQGDNMIINQEERQNIINSLISEWEYMKSSFTRVELEDDCGNSGIDVRLQVLEDSLELHIGDSQYDTNHLGYWGYATLDYDWDKNELESSVNELVSDLISQVEEAISMFC